MSDHGPIEVDAHTYMNTLAQAIQETLPEGFGFTFLMFKFGDPSGKKDSRMNYISNASREDMITALKELVANFEGRGHNAPKAKQ